MSNLSRLRQQQQSEQVRSRILEIARRILSEEGEEALSIRRITKEMDYSAGIIYHYFENKDEILLCILKEGYQKILAAVKPPDNALPPGEAIRASFSGYINGCLEWSAEYRALMFSSSPQILEFTSVLSEGICERRPAFDGLISALKAGISAGMFAPCDVPLTAQCLWTATFGLLARLIIEQDVSQEQKSRLIDRQIELLLKGLRP